jgi:hypothetical protein
VNRALTPDRQAFGMGVVKPRELKHIFGVLGGVERADHISPFVGGGHRDRAAARAIRQALDRHDLDILRDVWLAGLDDLRQGLDQPRAGALFLIRGRLIVQAARNADEKFRGGHALAPSSVGQIALASVPFPTGAQARRDRSSGW